MKVSELIERLRQMWPHNEVEIRPTETMFMGSKIVVKEIKQTDTRCIIEVEAKPHG